MWTKKYGCRRFRIGHVYGQAFIILVLFGIGMTHCGSGTDQQGESSTAGQAGIDAFSYNLGVIGGFAEVVDIGIKRLALSAALEPEVMDAIEDEAWQIADKNHVQIYRERDFLVTDLFPEDVTAGKHVLLIYKGETLNTYLTLKKEKAALVRSGGYVGAARHRIARKMGVLLSYPDERINGLLENRELED